MMRDGTIVDAVLISEQRSPKMQRNIGTRECIETRKERTGILG